MNAKGDLMTVAAGARAIRVIKLAYRADLPILIHGKHGVGKSELLREAAKELGVEFIVRDLSLMEPVDLVGLPRRAKGRTHFAPPSFLPTKGKGLLAFEELNRAPRYMAAPCLQLLTARTLNDYVLPSGWVPCAAVNDADDGYQVDELDAALLSRFVRVKIEPDVREWCTWARANNVHPKVVRFVGDNPNIFLDAQSNPRAWTYVSRLLRAIGQDQLTDELTAAIAGLVGETWAGAFAYYVGDDGPLDASTIIESYASHRAVVRRWRDEARLDLLEASWVHLRNHLQRQADFDAVIADPRKKKNVEQFLAALAPDLLRQARQWLQDHELGGLKLPKGVARDAQLRP